jgi:glycosyltransferase involved in cell wall biosynthesis
VGSSPYSNAYTAAINAAADGHVRLVGGVWDQHLLDQLYANALTYLHGHSVGGTNPSLLRAAGAGAFVIAFDVGFNREVMGASADYFTDCASVAVAIEAAESDPLLSSTRGLEGQCGIARYSWDDVADAYEGLLLDLATGGQKRRSQRPSGRRPFLGGRA